MKELAASGTESLSGAFLGRADEDQRAYMRVLLPDSGEACKRSAPLELLLPASSDSKYPAILRSAAVDALEERARAPTSVELHVKNPRDWLAALDLGDAAVSPIVVEDSFSSSGITAFYRLGGPSREVINAPIEIQTGWVCRSYWEQALLVSAFVPAFAVDAATSPLQLVFFALTIGP
jgi:hypothetical protein